MSARALGATDGDTLSLFQATWGLWLYNQSRSAHRRARELTVDLINYAGLVDDQTLNLQAHHATWTTKLFTAELASAIEHCESGISLYDEVLHRDQALHYGGHDPCVCGHVQGAMMFWLSGLPEKAERHNQLGLALSDKLCHSTTLVHAHMFSTRYRMMRNEPLAALSHARRLIELAEDMGLQLYAMFGETWIGWAIAMSGDLDTGLDQMKQVLAVRRAGRSHLEKPLELYFFADALAANEEYDESLSQLDEALESSKRTGESFWQAEIYRLQGDVLWRQGRSQPDKIKERLQQAIRFSQKIGAKGQELRAAYTLASVMHANGETNDVRALLKPVYEWFTEGHDTPDLKNARNLLQEIS